MGPKQNIYAIYASQDKGLAHDLLRRLQLLETDFNVSIWHDDPIYPEQVWKPQNASRLDADIILLLVSNAFMYSQFIQQDEFKTVIDTYKAGKATVIPILLDNCPWDIEFNSDDYDFSFKELNVLPENRKPISDWDSSDKALKQVTDWVRGLIDPIDETMDLEVREENLKTKTGKDLKEEQTALNFSEKGKIEGVVEEKKTREKAETKKRAEDENKRKQEEKRLKEEKAAKKVALEEKMLKEKIEVKKRDEQELKRKEEGQVKQREEDERIKEEAKARKSALDEKRIKEIAEAKKNAEAEIELRKEAQAKKRGEWENRLEEEADRRNSNLKATRRERLNKILRNTEETSTYETENQPLRKKVYLGVGIGALVILGIWIFSLLGPSPEKKVSTLPKTNTTSNQDSNAASEPNDAVLPKGDPELKIAVGDYYGGGLVFTLDASGTSGKIAHLEDAGPMTWENANAIHEELGDGWRLPTLDELRTMYKTIGQGATNKGEFSDGLYWSATPYDEYQARLLRFRDSNSSYHYNKMAEHRKFRVRAIRDF